MEKFDIEIMDAVQLRSTLIDLLEGKTKVRDGAIVPNEKVSGPRGPTAKVAPRLEACRSMFLEMSKNGATAKDLLEASNGTFIYTDILLVARNLMAEGLIVESRHGRKATWNLTTNE